MKGVTLCALGDFAANPVLATLETFREEYEQYIANAQAQHPQAVETLQDVTRKEAGELPETVPQGGV